MTQRDAVFPAEPNALMNYTAIQLLSDPKIYSLSLAR